MNSCGCLALTESSRLGLPYSLLPLKHYTFIFFSGNVKLKLFHPKKRREKF
jgi:hypothetical protein